MYTAYDVSKKANVTVRTLYHYHKIGLLIPKKINSEGVRFYDEENLERLQEILFYKELNFPLKEIKKFLENKVSREDILIGQKLLLEKKIDMLNKHIATIDKTLSKNKRTADSKEDLFAGFSRAEIDEMILKKGKYLYEKYGLDIKFDPKKLKSEELKKFIKFNKNYDEGMIRFLVDKRAPNDPEVVEAAYKHFKAHKKYFGEMNIDEYIQRFEIAMIDDYFRKHMEEAQVGITYFSHQVALYLKKRIEEEKE